MRIHIAQRSSHARAAFLVGAIVWCCAMLTAKPIHAQSCSRNMLRIFGPQSYVATPDVQALHLTHGFTIECWARLESPSASQAAIVDKGTYGIYLETDSTVSGMVQHSTAIRLTAPVDTLTSWHHFAFVFTPGDSLRLYIDSTEAASAAVSITALDSNTDSLRIGMGIAGGSWMGSIDEFRIWNVPRSLAEIKQTMDHVLAGSVPGLVLYYSFDDEAGSVRIHDFSGHARDGVVRGSSAEIVPSSSPVVDESPGFRLVAVESNIVIPTQRCKRSFDTVVHVRNLGSTPLYVDTVGFSVGQVFSIVPNSPFTLPADSNAIDSLRLHFEPIAGGRYVDSLYISSSSDCAGRIHVGIEAAYDSVGLTASTDTIRFDSVTQCSNDTVRTVTMRNTSVTDSVTIVGPVIPPSSGLLVLDTFPIALPSGGSALLHIALTHRGRGPLVAALGFELDKCSREVLLNVSAVRKAEQLSVPDTVNFGSAPATLAGVRRDTTIVVTNTGDTWTTIARAQAGPIDFLQVLGKARAGVPFGPGDTVQLHVEINAAGCGLQIGKLQITSSNCLVDTSTLALINLIPPAALTASSADFGTLCEPKDTLLYITNPNAFPVRLDSITYTQASLFTNGPFIDTIPAHDSVPVQFQLNASRNGDYQDTVYLHTTPCGTGMTILSANWGYANVTFDSGQLLFGRGCKIDPIVEVANLTNHTARTITLTSDSLIGSKRFLLDPFGFPIILKPGESKSFAINYTPSLGYLDTATFRLYSPEGCTAASLALRGSREIAKAVWQPTAGAFDTVCPGDSAEQTFQLRDKGIDSIDVRSVQVSGTGFTLVSSPTTLGNSGSFRVRFTPPREQPYSGTLTVLSDSCGTSFLLPLNGSGGPPPRISLLDTSYDFDSVRVGDSQDYCIAVANPSCTPLSVTANTSSLAGTPFQLLDDSSVGMISRGDTALLCVRFKPNTYGVFDASLLLSSDSASPRTITLRGVGLAPDVRFRPALLDFGYVLHHDSKTMMVYDTNLGNLGSRITASYRPPLFVVQQPDSLPPHALDSIAVTFSPLPTTGLVYDTLFLNWNGGRDSVLLRGFGTEPGLQLSAVGLDFGRVHVGNDSTLPLYLFATTNFPTIDRITIGARADTFSDTLSQSLPYTIQSDRDTVTVNVTYHAHLEQLDNDSIVIYSGGNSWRVPVTGRGVEAHPQMNPIQINFGTVTLGQSVTLQTVKLADTGGYPLYVKPLTPDSIFYTVPDSPSVAILPDSSRVFSTTFRPVRARTVEDTIQFRTSSPDSVPALILIGTGIYPAGTGPSFGYSVASITTEPGEFDSIPVSMSGIRLSKIDADSLLLEFRFDPQMVRMLGADAGLGTVPVSRFTRLNDSTVAATIAMSTFNGGTVMRLHTEALLGPHPLSYIRVMNSDPAADQPEADGAFNVADCGGAIHGVVFAGPYATSAIVPNPTGDKARLAFTLGLDGPVTVNIYNSIGELVKSVDLGTAKAGAHSLALDVSDLPQGRYVYRLTSLDYHSEGSLVIMR